jgi:SAM-dependent methyltransferase
MTVSELVQAAVRYREKLDKIKAARAGVGWYPYDSLANFTHIARLLGPARERLFDTLPSRRVLDVGAGDGDVSFFLESLGFEVEAIDSALSNHSALEGFRALQHELGSRVRLTECDLDGRWALEGREYALALNLGLLYHLKNPFYVMEELARRAHFCLVSCKIADLFEAAGEGSRAHLPLAYLVDSDELNDDNSNFWVFTETCLKRLFARSGWVVLDSLRVGAQCARAASRDDDARLFALLTSQKLRARVRPDSGWHESESDEWRWTEPRFRVGLPVLGREARALVIETNILEATLSAGVNALNCRVNSASEVQRVEIHSPGLRTFRFQIPAVDWPCGEILAEFWLDTPTVCPPGDSRQLGLVVIRMELR